MRRRRTDRFVFFIAVAVVWIAALFLATVIDVLEGLPR